MATRNLTARIVLRNDTSANFQSINPILIKGEIGLEIDTARYKIGDGSTAWNDLATYKHLTNAEYRKLKDLIEMLDKDEFGKVDDVTVNGDSVLGEDKIAKIVIGELSFSETAQGTTPEKFTQNIVLHKIAKTGDYNDLLNKLKVVDNLDSVSTNDALSANQGNALFKMIKALPAGKSFSDIQALVTALNGATADGMNVGSNLFIQTLNVPDFWVYSRENTSVTYTYTTDEDFINAIKTNGGVVQVGYYKVSILESDKVNLTDYYTKSEIDELISNLNLLFFEYLDSQYATKTELNEFMSDTTTSITSIIDDYITPLNKSVAGIDNRLKKIEEDDTILRSSDTFVINGGNSEV